MVVIGLRKTCLHVCVWQSPNKIEIQSTAVLSHCAAYSKKLGLRKKLFKNKQIQTHIPYEHLSGSGNRGDVYLRGSDLCDLLVVIE